MNSLKVVECFFVHSTYYRLYTDWISHVPKADDSHGIATVAPADTMLYEGTYEDYEILGDTAVQS